LVSGCNAAKGTGLFDHNTIPILIAAGIVATLLAWGTVAGHAIRIARANPVLALRYE
jgi:hypothetical protein